MQEAVSTDGKVLTKKVVRVLCGWSVQYVQPPAIAQTALFVGARPHVRTAQYNDYRQRVQNDWCSVGPIHGQGVPARILRFSEALMLSTTCAG
jgi:hypothetical protein